MLSQIESWITNALQNVFDQFGWLGVAAMMAFENATGITPSEIILGMAGWFLVSRHELPLAFIFLGGFYAASGSLLGASLTYWAVRSGGRPIVDKFAGWFRVDYSHITRAEAQFQRWGPGLVLFGRMLPGVRTLVSIPAGLARMPFGKFALATFIGAYAWCTLLIGVGFWLGEEWEQIGGLLEQYALPSLAMVLVMVGLFWWFQRSGKKRLTALIKRGQWASGSD